MTDLTSLRPDSSIAEKMASLERFLAAWWSVDFNRASDPETANLPEALRLLYHFAGSNLEAIFPQNRMLKPAEFAVETDRTVFYVENQGVLKWGYASGDDPEVWELVTETREWRRASPSLTDFLVYAALGEALLLAPCRAQAEGVSAEVISKLDAIARPLALPEIPFLNGARYGVHGSSAIAWVAPGASGSDWNVFIGGVEESAMEFVWDLSDDSWEIDI